MTNDARDSPRAAIRSWLQHTGSSPRPEQRNIANTPPGKSHTSERQRGNQRVDKYSRRPPDQLNPLQRNVHRDKRIHYRPSPTKVQANLSPSRPPQPRPGDAAYAEHLGLHAPFRNFRADNDIVDVDFTATARPVRRKRKASSTSSYLEPAVMDDFAEDSNTIEDLAKQPRARQAHSRLGGSSVGRSLEPENLSTTIHSSPKKPAKSYERRPRRKTRDDHYKLKEGRSERTKRPAKRKKGLEKDGRKRAKRKEKSGAALMHGFSAQNVANERLTLHPARALGLFGKGRASSPVRRRGLPDLAFNEMVFLKGRRPMLDTAADDREAAGPRSKDRMRKSRKAADTEAEISRYFTSVKAVGHETPTFQSREKPPNLQERSCVNGSPPAFVEMPVTPFLGFGSCGTNSISPVKRPDTRTLEALERRLTKSPARSASYFTWPETQVTSKSSPRQTDPGILPLQSTKNSNQNRSHAKRNEQNSMKEREPSASHATRREPVAAATRSKGSQTSGSGGQPLGMLERLSNDSNDGQKPPVNHPKVNTRLSRVESGQEARGRHSNACDATGSTRHRSRGFTDQSPAKATVVAQFPSPSLKPSRTMENPDDVMIEDLLQSCQRQDNIQSMACVSPSHSEPCKESINRDYAGLEKESLSMQNKETHPEPTLSTTNNLSAATSPHPCSSSYFQSGSRWQHSEALESTQSRSRPSVPYSIPREVTQNTPRPPSSFRVSTTGFGDAWMCYHNIYKQQCGPADLKPAEDRAYRTQSFPLDSAVVQVCPHRIGDRLLSNEPNEHLMALIYDTEDQAFDLDADMLDRPDMDPLEEKLFLDGAFGEKLGECSEDDGRARGPVDSSLDHEVDPQNQNINIGRHLGLRQLSRSRDWEPLVECPRDVLTWRTIAEPASAHNTVEGWSNVHQDIDDSGLSGFWTPNKLY